MAAVPNEAAEREALEEAGHGRRGLWRWGWGHAFLAIWLVGTWGFQQVRHQPPTAASLVDSGYRALQLFTLQFVVEPGWNSTALLDLTRYVAGGFVFFAVVQAASGALARRLRLSLDIGLSKHGVAGRIVTGLGLGRLAPRRAVVIGLGPVGRTVASALGRSAGPWRIALVDREAGEGAETLARELGAVAFSGSADDEALMRRLDLAGVDRIVVSAETDAEALSTAARVRQALKRRGSKARLLVHVADVWLTETLRDGPAAAVTAEGLELFNLRLETARQLVGGAWFDRMALEAGQPRTHLVLIGFGDQAEAILIEQALNRRTGLLPPRFTVLDLDPQAGERRFRARWPRLRLGAGLEEADVEIRFERFQAGAESFIDSSLLGALEDDPAPPTAYVFACGDDQLNLTSALGLQSAMERAERSPAPIYVRLWNRHDRSRLRLGHGGPFGLIHGFGSLEAAVRASPVLSDDPDAGARAMNDAYSRSSEEMFGEPGPGWETLPENKKESNRRAARYGYAKLADLGFQWRFAGSQKLPRVEPTDAAAILAEDRPELYAASATASPVVAVAKAEHARWLIDRGLDGWRAAGEGERRDDQRRIHPSMAPFEPLEARIKRYDFVMARALLRRGEDPAAPGPRAWPALAIELPLGPAMATGPSTMGAELLSKATEVLVRLEPALGTLEEEDRDALAAAVSQALSPERAPRLARVRFVLDQPMADGEEAVARAISADLASGVEAAVTRLYGRGVSRTSGRADPGASTAYLRRWTGGRRIEPSAASDMVHGRFTAPASAPA